MQTRAWFSSLVAAASLAGLASCVDIKTDPGEGSGDMPAAGPTVEFDPANAILPFPSDLARDPTTGKVAIPAQCGEGPVQKALRENVLNSLDGFGTYESALRVTFSEEVDADSLAGHVFLYKRANNGTEVGAPGTAIPLTIIKSQTARFDASCANPQMISAAVLVPQGVLEQRATYDVAVTSGVKTAAGTAYGKTFTWALISQADSPVQVDANGDITLNRTPLDPREAAQKTQLLGIAQLWQAHKHALDFLDKAGVKRADILVAWEFTTQTTTDPLDPTVADSLAAKVLTAGPLGTQTIIPEGVTPTQFLTAAGLPCGPALPCDQIGDVIGGIMGSASYQQDVPNPLAGGMPIPGPWNDPIKPTQVKVNQIQFIATVPVGTPPPGGWPVVVFGHGLGSTKKSVLVIAPRLAARGFASIAIDFVDHDSRAVQTSTEAALGCSGTPDPTTAPQCFALFLSTDLAGTRDNIRQSVLDVEREISMLKACSASSPAATCGAELHIDPENIFYMGISLGGIIGSTVVAASPDIKAAVLNVPGVGLLDVLENTDNLQIRCSLVNALIDAGVLVGDKWNGGSTGLCTTAAWKAQASYQTFASAARWVLDPADGANFTPKLATRHFLIQEVIGDMVVPNIATEREAALVGLGGMPLTADPATSFPPLPPPSSVITTNEGSNKWVKYPTLPANGAFPGNSFQHASLLQPVADGNAGILGTARIQSDAIDFLVYAHNH